MKKMYLGGDIITMKEEGNYAEAVIVENGLIKKTGTVPELRAFIDKDTEVIDLEGKTLMPSFIDSHSHIASVAARAVMADLSGCGSFSEIVNTLKSHMKKRGIKSGELVAGYGYDHYMLAEQRHPTKELLNKVSSDNPVYITHVSGHMGCANDFALKLAGLNEGVPDIEGGFFGRIENTNIPNGYFEEKAKSLFHKKIMQIAKIDVRELMPLAQEIYLENGITTAQNGNSQTDMTPLFIDLASEGKLNIDIVTLLPAGLQGTEVEEKYLPYVNRYYNHFKIGGYKIILDGSPQAKTAWLTMPYEGEETYGGYPLLKDEDVRKYIEYAINSNMQMLAHCNGDAAADQFLNCYEKELESSANVNKKNLRPVMIHCQLARKDQLDRMAELNMTASMFIAHTYYWGDVHLKNLGVDRAMGISPAKSAMDRGLNVTFHQDSPVVYPSMLHTIWCAVNRMSKKGEIIGKSECISVYDALKAVTVNAAYQYFEENIKGSVEEGKMADLVILDKNPLKVQESELKDITVLETIKEGNSLYKKNQIMDKKN